MNIIANGVIYFPTHDFKSARRMQGFDKIGEAEHIQGNEHKFVFSKIKLLVNVRSRFNIQETRKFTFLNLRIQQINFIKKN